MAAGAGGAGWPRPLPHSAGSCVVPYPGQPCCDVIDPEMPGPRGAGSWAGGGSREEGAVQAEGGAAPARLRPCPRQWAQVGLGESRHVLEASKVQLRSQDFTS